MMQIISNFALGEAASSDAKAYACITAAPTVMTTRNSVTCSMLKKKAIGDLAFACFTA